MTKPRISVITVVYNGEKHIARCLQNVVDQKCPWVEQIVVDGGSQDKTVSIVQDFAKRHPHIRWVSEKDKGQSDAMNKGIALAQGEIIGILNCDDDYEPGVLNFVVEKFQGLMAPSLLVGNCRILDDDGKLLELNKPKDLNLVAFFLDWNVTPIPCNPCAYFYHKSLHEKIGFYNVDEHYAMDLDFLFRAVDAAHTKYVNRIFGNWRFIKGSKTYEAKIRGEMEDNCGRVKKRCMESLPSNHPARNESLRWFLTRWVYYSGEALIALKLKSKT